MCFSKFPKTKNHYYAEEDHTSYWSKKTCHPCKYEFIQDDKIIVKSENIATLQEIIKELHIQYVVSVITKIALFR